MMNDPIIVVGAGVAGLTCAVRLLEAGYAVRVVATQLSTDPPRERTPGDPPGPCSPRAGAVWYPYHVEPAAKVTRWGRASRLRYAELVEVAGSGVSMVPLTLYWGDDPGDAEWSLLDGCDLQMLSADALPSGYAAGVRLRVPFIDTSVFLPFLEARVRALGGTLERRPPLRSLAELRDEAAVLVNCTGLGAKELCGDPDMVPERGQVLYVRAPAVKRWSVALPRGGHPIYVFPRTNECVLGGTNEPGAWDERTDDAALAAIQESCRALEPALAAGYEVLGSAAGLRPMRTSGVRLEPEPLGGGRTVIHNYGHGGAGFTVAWGCAEEVAELVKTRMPAGPARENTVDSADSV
jgi:D-amino-acid oxidase